MGVQVPHELWNIRWDFVKMPGPNKLMQALHTDRTGFTYQHPDFEAARQWCLGAMIRREFVPRHSGYFRFREARDAMAFKLAWAGDLLG